MKLSEATTQTVREFLRLDETQEEVSVSAILAAARSYILGYTGLDSDGADTHEDLTIALLALCSDMYDKRQMTVENDKVNRVTQSIMDLYAVNLV
jgi:uncharacterized phage protein (predicted DNA packaging)